MMVNRIEIVSYEDVHNLYVDTRYAHCFIRTIDRREEIIKTLRMYSGNNRETVMESDKLLLYIAIFIYWQAIAD